MVQELGLEKRATLTHSEADLRCQYLLHSQAESVSTLKATTAHIQGRIESLSVPLQCVLVNRRPVLRLKCQLGSRRRLKLLSKERRLQRKQQPDPSPTVEEQVRIN